MLMGSSGLNWFDSQSGPIPVRGLWAAPNYPLNWTSPGCWLGVPSPLQVLGLLIVACVNSMPLQLIQNKQTAFFQSAVFVHQLFGISVPIFVNLKKKNFEMNECSGDYPPETKYLVVFDPLQKLGLQNLRYQSG